MQLDHCIHERRSIHKFTKEDISWEHMAEIIDAGRYAPAAGNVRNMRCIIVRNKEFKKLVQEACPEQHWIEKAPVLVVVCSDMDQLKTLYGVRGDALYAIQNVAAAAQNMLLKAHALGIGSCWIGDFDEKKLKTFFQIENGVRPQMILAFGYSNEKPDQPALEPLENLLFFEHYGKRVNLKPQTPLEKTLEHAIERVKTGLEKLQKKKDST
ncbi:nitroreductase family protein [Candidatus Woesearchaeota archaeon]|nr:nitroreductase family protein [Candidatus Woesearchaeota archaeon]